MATQTSKTDQARQQREARAAERKAAAEQAAVEAGTVEGAVLPGGTTVKRSGKAVPAGEQKAETKALQTPRKPRVADVTIEEVEELPKPAPRKTEAMAIWGARLTAVKNSKTGKAKIYSCNKATTANGTAYRVRKALKDGRIEGHGADDFNIVVHDVDIYAEVKRPA